MPNCSVGSNNLISNQQKLKQQKEIEEIKKLILPNPGGPFSINRNMVNSPVILDRNIESPSTCEFTNDSSKKYSNDTKSSDDFQKDRLGLFSAQISYKNYFNTNNTLFSMSTRRPLSNLNNGNKNILEGLELNNNIVNSINTDNDVVNNKKCVKYKKPLSQKSRVRNSTRDNNCLLKSAGSLLSDSLHFNCNSKLNNVSPKKLHKIKIERGMMSTKFVDKLIKKLHFDLSTQTFKRGCLMDTNF